jgi:hypothetical protein
MVTRSVTYSNRFSASSYLWLLPGNRVPVFHQLQSSSRIPRKWADCCGKAGFRVRNEHIWPYTPPVIFTDVIITVQRVAGKP